MARLGLRERREFLAVRDLCRSDQGTGALLGTVGNRLRRFVGGDAFCAMELDPATALPMMTVEENWPDDSAYAARRARDAAQPVLRSAARVAPGSAHRRGRTTPGHRLRRRGSLFPVSSAAVRLLP